MVSPAAQAAAACIGASMLYVALCHPRVAGSPEFAVGMNTFSLVMFTMYLYECRQYDGADANKPNAFVKSLSNRAVGALFLVGFAFYTSISNAQVVHKTKL